MKKHSSGKKIFKTGIIFTVAPGMLIGMLVFLVIISNWPKGEKSDTSKVYGQNQIQDSIIKQSDLKNLIGVTADGYYYAYLENSGSKDSKIIIWDTLIKKNILQMNNGLQDITNVNECIFDFDNKKIFCQNDKTLYMIDLTNGQVTDILEKYELKSNSPDVICYVGYFDYSDDNLYFSIHYLDKKNMTAPVNKLYHVYWDKCEEVVLKITDNSYLRPLKIIDNDYIYVLRTINNKNIKNEKMYYYLYKVDFSGKILNSKYNKMPINNYGMASPDCSKIFYSTREDDADLNIYDFKSGESMELCNGDSEGKCIKKFWLKGNRIMAIINEPSNEAGKYNTIARVFNIL